MQLNLEIITYLILKTKPHGNNNAFDKQIVDSERRDNAPRGKPVPLFESENYNGKQRLKNIICLGRRNNHKQKNDQIGRNCYKKNKHNPKRER